MLSPRDAHERAFLGFTPEEIVELQAIGHPLTSLFNGFTLTMLAVGFLSLCGVSLFRVRPPQPPAALLPDRTPPALLDLPLVPLDGPTVPTGKGLELKLAPGLKATGARWTPQEGITVQSRVFHEDEQPTAYLITLPDFNYTTAPPMLQAVLYERR